jgi:hypothetical protein
VHTMTSHPPDGPLIRWGWWAIVLTCFVFGVFALTMGVAQLLFTLGVATEVKHRASPLVFMIHAFAGAAALLVGPLQALANTPLPPSIGYPLAVFLSGALNLAAAEFWVRRTRSITEVCMTCER